MGEAYGVCDATSQQECWVDNGETENMVRWVRDNKSF